MTKQSPKAWHTLTTEDLVTEFDSHAEQGLSAAAAKERLDRYGPNKLPEQKKRGPLLRFLFQFHNVLIYLLLVASVVAAFLGEWIESGVIVAVVLINVTVSFIQEGRAERALEGIRKMLSLDATVIRNGKRETINAEYLVPGDLVQLKSGDKIPADMRLLSVKNLRAEESALTGESEEVEKTTDPVEEESALGDRTNMAFSGTTITYGTATGIVVATGAHTELGKINRMISEVQERKTPLLIKIDRFAKILSVAIVAVAGAFFVYGYYVQQFDLDEMFLAAISIVVASIPEGLPAILTITLALGVQRMAARHAIVRRLPSVETLGSVSVICSDKTGTLTRNEMTVRSIVTAEAFYDVEGSGYRPEGPIRRDDQEINPDDDPVLLRFLQSARACNDATLQENNDGTWTIDGTPTEGALMTLAHKAGLADFDPDRIDSVPFESEHKYKATLHPLDEERIVFVVGAPERILDRCDHVLKEGGESELDRDFWTERMEDVAARGERVIACAFRRVPGNPDAIEHEDLKDSLTFIGIAGILDPPREEVLEAIKECKDAGIRVIMITGDHAATAQAVAGQLGIKVDEEPVTGTQLEEMSDQEVRETVKTHNVFARTNPEHKLRLVKALQDNGLLCAMTGDGVNDAPALKNADIGIAMGIKGTEVTKEAAEMVLADDNFASIVHAVEEGRTIYDNIKKTILFLLPANGAEASVIMVAVLFGVTLPISPAQILWVNMVSAVTLALALTVEPMEQLVMKRPPRKADAPILAKSFFMRILFISLLSGGFTLSAFLLNYEKGMDGEALAQARTIAVNMLILAHVFYLFTCRKLYETSMGRTFFDNRVSFMLVGVLLLLQMAFTYLPFMNTLFGTAPIPARTWLWLAGGGVLVFLAAELEKHLTRHLYTVQSEPADS